MSDHELSGVADAADRMNRRSALKKAAAAGAVVWTAPLLLSEPALAAGTTCTPKCKPGGFTALQGTVDGFCPSPGNKAARVSLRVAGTGATCPCLTNGVAIAPTTCIKLTDIWRKDGTGQDVTVATTTPAAGYTQGFYVAKPGGSLGQGLWVSDDQFKFAVTCQDRDGNKISTVCRYVIGFNFDPAGNCGTPSNLSLSPAGCVTACFDNPCA